jgi:hypothetical protein
LKKLGFDPIDRLPLSLGDFISSNFKRLRDPHAVGRFFGVKAFLIPRRAAHHQLTRQDVHEFHAGVCVAHGCRRNWPWQPAAGLQFCIAFEPEIENAYFDTLSGYPLIQPRCRSSAPRVGVTTGRMRVATSQSGIDAAPISRDACRTAPNRSGAYAAAATHADMLAAIHAVRKSDRTRAPAAWVAWREPRARTTQAGASDEDNSRVVAQPVMTIGGDGHDPRQSREMSKATNQGSLNAISSPL